MQVEERELRKLKVGKCVLEISVRFQRLECVSYHCYNKFRVSKQPNFTVSQFWGQDTAWPNRIHCSDSHMPNQGVNSAVFLSGGFGDRFTSKLI